MRYTITEFQAQFPGEEACLDYIFHQRFPDSTGYHKIPGRKAYVNKTGHQIYPLKGTIFEKSSTPLLLWFFATYLFSQSKNGVSAKELERQLGVTYKTAWRMGKHIRSLMKQPKGKFFGVVEADETYIGGTRRMSCWHKKKTPVLGVVERKGRARAITLPDLTGFSIVPFVERNIRRRATLYTDEAPVYKSITRFKRGTVVHSKREYVRGKVYTNSVEGFWGLLKPALKGTYRYVSKKYLQSYVDEFVWKYNARLCSEPLLFQLLGNL